jgi:hypothetical protein
MKKRPNSPPMLKSVRELGREKALLPGEHRPVATHRKNTLRLVQNSEPILPGQPRASAEDEPMENSLGDIVWATDTHRIDVRPNLRPPMVNSNRFMVHRP